MMSDFASMDWDLQAVIRGPWSSTAADPTVMSQAPTGGDYDFNGQDQELFFGSFPDIFESAAATTADFFDELEGMYKPFYPPTSPPQETVARVSFQFQQQPGTQVVVKEEEPQLHNVNGPSPVISAVTSASTAAQVAKYKRSRKNQQKRVVEQARAEGLSSSDKWAWRKYGQKPIKGSPYPRSYYRCSSSKGCPARKQVEQSFADPGMYIITYTADHNHSHPTRRNSLSGVARTKFSAPKKYPTRQDNDNNDNNSCSPYSAPTFGSSDSFVKTEDVEDSLQGENMEIFMSDIVFSDDVFPSLEDLHGCIMD